MKLLKVLLLFTAFSSFAQIRFESGYFIDNSGLRQDVLIKNIEWKNNPAIFDYKTAESAEVQQRTITNTPEFSVGGITYKRFDVSIDRSTTIIEKLSDTPAIDWKSETLFLKLLANGKLALYQYEDSNLVKYFYSDGNHDKATQLLYREHREDGMIIKNTNYRQQLFNLMKDKYIDSQKFKNIKYTRSALTDIFEDYNGTTAENSINSDKNAGSFNMKVTAGATSSSLDIEIINGFRNEFDPETGFRAGLQLEYIFPFNKNKLALFADPNYQSYKSENTNGIVTWKVDYQKIEVPVGVRHYSYLTDDMRIFVNAAFLFNFEIGDSYIQRNATDKIPVKRASAWALGGGFAYDRFAIEGRYVFRHGITDATFSATDFSSMHVILSYQLF